MMTKRLILWTMALPTLSSCDVVEPGDIEQLNADDGVRVQLYYNSPSTRADNERNLHPDDILVDVIDRAQNTLDVCVYGFSRQPVIDAVVRAHYRGVNVRVVGDARHFGYGERGYRAIQEHRIPMQVGNQFHIMHNKFFIIDERFTFVGTGNITTTGFTKNSNNWLLIDDEAMAADFNAEFEQMFAGRFSTAKVRNNNGNKYRVGDTEIEVLFSPHEDSMGKMLQELDAAHTSVHFQIFAFTKDQVGSRFVRLQDKFNAYNRAEDKIDLPAVESRGTWTQWPPPNERPKKVVGILDKSQLHGNGQYHEGYRLSASLIPMRIDANANSYLPGDYQAGGGRLHTKTMILDYGTPDARVVTGSFNWSSAATIANDEVLLILRGQRIVDLYMRIWRQLWDNSVTLPDGLCSVNDRAPDREGGDWEDAPAVGEGYVCAPDVEPGDVVISEVHWDGWNDRTDPADRTGNTRDQLTNDEFIELYNTTDRPIDLSMWTIWNGFDSAMGFTPGTVIQPRSYFLIADHNRPPYSELEPQRGFHAFPQADFVLNQVNDPRFPRLNLKNTQFRIELRAPRDTTGANPDFTPNIIDAVGDLRPPYAGGRIGNKTYSMERRFIDGEPAMPGDDPDNWFACDGEQGGEFVNEEFRDVIVATPRAPNTNP